MSLFGELKRRNVFRAAIAYIIFAWMLLQIVEFVLEIVGSPLWIIQTLVVLAAAGLPAVVVFAWVFELTPDGFKRDSDVPPEASFRPLTARRLDTVTLFSLSMLVAFIIADRVRNGDRQDIPESQPADTVQAVESSPAPAPDTDTDTSPSIAVLPFTTRSTSEEDQFFSDGMHDDLLTQLAKLGSLKVISRTSVLEYRDTTKNLRQVGDELGVKNILEGGVQRSGNAVRINMQLIDADTDEHLWAETFDRQITADNLFAIQSEIARAVTSALHATLTPAEQSALEQPMTGNLEALDAYRRGRSYSNTFVEDDLFKAEQELLRAVELDQEFAEAWAWLAYTRMAQYWAIEESAEFKRQAWEAIEAARALDPDIPDLAVAEGYYHYWGGLDYEQALAVLEPALERYPNHSELLQAAAFTNRRYGRIESALEYLQRAYELSPRDVELAYAIGETYVPLWAYPEANHWLEVTLALNPAHPRGLQLKALLQIYEADDPAAAAHYLAMASRDMKWLTTAYWEALIQARDWETALELTQSEALSIPALASTPPDMLAGITLLLAGDEEAAGPRLRAAIPILESVLERDPEMLITGHLGLCQVHGALGDQASARQACRQAESVLTDDAFGRYLAEFQIIIGLSMAGLVDEAIELLELTMQQPFRMSTRPLRRDPRLENLRQDPRFESILREAEATAP